MRQLIIVLASVLALTGPVKAQTNPIQSVITEQLRAFQADDFATAFTFASPMIQQIFGDPERFGAMVKNGYPMVWRPSDVKFGKFFTNGGRFVQIVYLTDQAGRSFEAAYEMVETDGIWEINGVSIREADIGA